MPLDLERNGIRSEPVPFLEVPCRIRPRPVSVVLMGNSLGERIGDHLRNPGTLRALIG